MERTAGWEVRLADALARWRMASFAWGESDCLLFCGEVVEALTEIDMTSAYRGKYDNARGAAKLLGGKPGRLITGFLDERFERQPVAMARRGDVVFVTDGEDRLFGGAAAVVDLNGRAILALSEEGMKALPMERAAAAWAVG